MLKRKVYVLAAGLLFSFLLFGCSKRNIRTDASGAVSKESELMPGSYAAENPDEVLYNKALEEQNSMHYAYAKELFENIKYYKDARAHYDNLIKILLPYNGTYRIESENGGFYTLTITDGVGSIAWDNEEGVQTLNLYGMYFRDVSDKVTMVFDVNLGEEDWYYSDTQDKYIIEIDELDNVVIQGLDSNENHVWDGTGEREAEK